MNRTPDWVMELQAAAEKARPGSASLPVMLEDCWVTTAFLDSASTKQKRTHISTANTVQHWHLRQHNNNNNHYGMVSA